MKKSMLITSVIMVIVLAIALTTSSLAWYTGAAGTKTVTAGNLSVSAKQVQAGTGLVISADGGTFGTTAVLSGVAVPNMTPVAPLGCSKDGDAETELTETLLKELDELPETLAFGSVELVAGDAGSVKKATPVFAKSAPFYVASTGKAVQPTIKVNFIKSAQAYTPAQNDPILWVAVLAIDLDAAGQETGEWSVVHIAASKDGSAMTVFVVDAVPDTGNTSALVDITYDPSWEWEVPTLDAAGDNAWGLATKFVAIAWYDGNSLVNSNSTFSLEYNVTFTDPAAPDPNA